MGVSYGDLSLLRFIQNRQSVPLSKVAAQFGKNESSIRRAIEQVNLYSAAPMIDIRKGYCLSRLNYESFVTFIRQIRMEDYQSSYKERIRVMVVVIFFEGYVNATSLYERWGLSLTTKKQDTAYLRQFLSVHGLKLETLKKRGLVIQGDELQLRFLVIDILHPLLEFTAENRIEARFANTPLENQSYDLAGGYLHRVSHRAVDKLNGFLTDFGLSLNYPSKKFLLLFICMMEIRLEHPGMVFSYRLPLAPLNLEVSDLSRENRLYNVAFSMMNFSQSLDFPFDAHLWQTTEHFAQQVVGSLKRSFPIREDFLNELYSYFYREITLNHFHCTFVDKTVENTKGQFPELYQVIEKYGVYFKATFDFAFMDEHISTLTLLVQKHVIRSQIVNRQRKKIVVITSINFERISFFLEQLRDQVAFSWVGTFNINEIHRLEELYYHQILCFSFRIYNILSARNLPVIRVNFFLEDSDIEHLLARGFNPIRHRFLAGNFVMELAGKGEEEIVEYLTEHYGDHFM